MLGLEKSLEYGKKWILEYITEQTSIEYLIGFKYGLQTGRDMNYNERLIYDQYISARIKELIKEKHIKKCQI